MEEVCGALGKVSKRGMSIMEDDHYSL